MPAALHLFYMLVCVWLMPALLSAQQPDYSISVREYHTTIEPLQNGDTRVTERITVDVTGRGVLGGLARGIRAATEGPDGKMVPAAVQVEELSVNGNPIRKDEIIKKGSLNRVLMRAEGGLRKGEHRFTIRYTVSGQNFEHDGGEALVWNALDAEWKGGVQKATAVFFPKPGCTFSMCEATLRVGAERRATIEGRVECIDGREAVVFESPRALEERECMTCAGVWKASQTLADAPTAPAPAVAQQQAQAPHAGVYNANTALSDFKVMNYVTTVEIEANAEIVVTELITIYLPSSGTNKGIIRDIPVNLRWRDRGREDVSFEVLSVKVDGNVCRTDDVERSSSTCSVYMRDKSTYLAAGYHTFELRYRMSEQVGFFPEHDELTWNAVGRGWQLGVAQATAVFIPPPGSNFTQHKAWIGTAGSMDSPVKIRKESREGREVLVFEAERPMAYGEDFTCAVAWPKGAVTPTLTTNPSDEIVFTTLYALLLVGSIAATWRLWHVAGKKAPKSLPVIPLFYPPKSPQRLLGSGEEHGEYLSPAAVRFIRKEGELGGRGMAATLLSLCMRGDCELSGNARTGFRLLKHASTSPAPEERIVASILPKNLLINNEKAGRENPIGKACDACEALLGRDYDVSTKHMGEQALLFCSVSLLMLVLVCVQLAGDFNELVLADLVLLIPGVFCMVAGVSGCYATYKRFRKASFAWKAMMIVMVAGFLGMGWLMLIVGDVFWLCSREQVALMILSLLPPSISFLVETPTKEQTELRNQIDGLALYIGTAETQRFNLLNPPQEDLALYHRLLPYAVALDLEEAWGARFADKLEAELYDSSEQEMLYRHLADRDMLISMERTITTYRSAVERYQSSVHSSGGGSSFSGGGGAGSGGGGGGGRAC